MTTAFYRAFEDRFRGNDALIKQRLTVYLPYLQPYRQLTPPATGIDLGCGRGEWLELLVSQGIAAQGCDSSADMLQAVSAQGVQVHCQELFDFLSAQPDKSADIITAFHVIEHIAPERLADLLQQIRRVLKPGGMVILETPNPDNILVGSHFFYLDPTHIAPVPSIRLSFMLEYYGFSQVHTLGLQEPQHYSLSAIDTLQQVFCSVSPDYAAVAYCPAQTTTDDSPRVQQTTGRDLAAVLASYDANLQAKLSSLSALQQQLQTLQTQYDTLSQQHAQTRALLQLVFDSPCWKLCSPLRWLKRKIRAFWPA